MPTRAPLALACLVGFLTPMKAARFDVAGLSLYLSYLVAAVLFIRYSRETISSLVRWFAIPTSVMVLLAAWGAARGAGVIEPSITLGKMFIAFGTTAAFMAVLRRAERAVFTGLFLGMSVSVLYMAYQWVSSVFFGFALPFTSSVRLQIGLGLSRRYGLARVTGFTEEPSFIATMLAGSVLLLLNYAHRRERPRFFRTAAVIGVVGLALCTSNNLFATIIIVVGSWVFIRRRRIGAVLVVYYLAAIAVTPYVLNRDITYYARFSPYEIFLRSAPIDQLLGRGLGSYPAYFREQNVTFDGIDVLSLASMWGGFLFEGGLVVTVLVILWLSGIIRRTGWREGLTLLTVLLMLSNYNSPWWPLVSLALAQCLVLHRKDPQWTPTSISAATPVVFGGTSPSSSPSLS